MSCDSAPEKGGLLLSPQQQARLERSLTRQAYNTVTTLPKDELPDESELTIPSVVPNEPAVGSEKQGTPNADWRAQRKCDEINAEDFFLEEPLHNRIGKAVLCDMHGA